jgi:Cdc6-like AAA superfamily ATPase
MNNTNYIPTAVDQILVPHKDFQKAKSRIETHLLAAQSYQEPTCLAVVGESRTGKSRLIENITKQYPKIRTSEGSVIPVLSIRTPSKPTVKALVEVLLKEIGDPLWFKRGSENEKTERLYTLLKQTKTHTVTIDEFQHFYDKVSHKVQHYLSDWLKIFVDRFGLMLIVACLPDCMAVINQNQQLRGRVVNLYQYSLFIYLKCSDIFIKVCYIYT